MYQKDRQLELKSDIVCEARETVYAVGSDKRIVNLTPVAFFYLI